VAREVGVATITASVVLNGSRSATRVSEATRARIIEAAARLHYRPNGVARGLTRRRMDTVGVVGRFIEQEVNTYFIEVLAGILEASARHNQNTSIIAVSDWSEEQDKILRFCDGRIDGIILVAPEDMSNDFAMRLLDYAPYVMLHNNNASTVADSLDVDNEGGYYSAVKHLTDFGHRRIVHFAGQQHLSGPRQRLAGYRRALGDANIPFDQSLIFPGDYNASSGRANAEKFLTVFSEQDRPTAIACANDVVACACAETLAARNISIPGQVSIVGFDDTALARMSSPPLTTVRQPLHAMGVHSVGKLLYRIKESLDQPKEASTVETNDCELKSGEANDNTSRIAKPQTEIFPVTLIIRESTGPAP